MKWSQLALLTWFVASPALAGGPEISRVVAYRPQPVFERVEHPAAGPGRKLVAVEIPASLKSEFEADQLNVAVKFSAPRPTDSCNETKVYGLIALNEVPAALGLTYFTLEIKQGKVSKTLKACNQIKHEVRNVEISTELRAPRPLRDTQVFDVPEDVEVSITIWRPIATIEALPSR